MITGELIYKAGEERAGIQQGMFKNRFPVHQFALDCAVKQEQANFETAELFQDFKEFLTYILPNGCAQLKEIFLEFDKWQETGEITYTL